MAYRSVTQNVYLVSCYQYHLYCRILYFAYHLCFYCHRITFTSVSALFS